MPSIKSRVPYPLWVRIICCLAPVGCVVVLCISATFGAQISWPVAASIFGLCGYVVRSVI